MHFVVELMVDDISTAHILFFRPWMFNSKKKQTLWKDCIVDNFYNFSAERVKGFYSKLFYFSWVEGADADNSRAL